MLWHPVRIADDDAGTMTLVMEGGHLIRTARSYRWHYIAVRRLDPAWGFVSEIEAGPDYTYSGSELPEALCALRGGLRPLSLGALLHFDSCEARAVQERGLVDQAVWRRYQFLLRWSRGDHCDERQMRLWERAAAIYVGRINRINDWIARLKAAAGMQWQASPIADDGAESMMMKVEGGRIIRTHRYHHNHLQYWAVPWVDPSWRLTSEMEASGSVAYRGFDFAEAILSLRPATPPRFTLRDALHLDGLEVHRCAYRGLIDSAVRRRHNLLVTWTAADSCDYRVVNLRERYPAIYAKRVTRLREMLDRIKAGADIAR